MLRNLFLLTFCLIILIACSDDAPQERAQGPRPVKILKVGASSTSAFLELPGSVQAARETNVAFEVSGRINQILVNEGDEIKFDSVIATLDPRDFESSRDSALAERNSARADYNRYVEARKANAVTPQTVDIAKRNLDVAEASLRTAEKAVEDTVLRAPFDGRIAKKIVAEFSNVQAKQAIVVLHDESSLEVTVNVAERDWARAKPGMTLAEATAILAPVIEISALPGRYFDAQAKSYSTAVDPVTRTYEATFSFDAPTDKVVSPGMTAKVRLTKPSDLDDGQIGVRIPSGAVFTTSDGQPSVWLIDDTDHTTKQAVDLGPLVGDELTITSGLESGSRIAISGVHTLVSGTHVRPLNP